MKERQCTREAPGITLEAAERVRPRNTPSPARVGGKYPHTRSSKKTPEAPREYLNFNNRGERVTPAEPYPAAPGPLHGEIPACEGRCTVGT
ncbi:hypothetical protein JCM10135_04330 [Stetteria hydrogenophila]